MTVTCNFPEIKAIHVSAKRWFQKSYGNTYHTVKVSYLVGTYWETVYVSEDMVYGYGEHYMHTAGKALINAGILTMEDGYKFSRINMENIGIKLTYNAEDVNRKKDLWFN